MIMINDVMNREHLVLKYSFCYEDLYHTTKLRELDQHFINQLPFELKHQLKQARDNFIKWQPCHSKLAIDLAPYLEQFITELFSINIDKTHYSALARIYSCKRSFIQRYALKSNLVGYNSIKELAKLISPNLGQYDLAHFEQIFAEYSLNWLKEQDQAKLDIAICYAIWACRDKAGIKKHRAGTLFKLPTKLDSESLVDLEESTQNGVKSLRVPQEELRAREGFKLTDNGSDLNFAVDQANYCIHCHKQEKDSCSKGIDEAKAGCPLDEKISEMNLLQVQGDAIAALAMAIIDNPMLAATGHRICNDCMKACIYQKQQPVDIPQIETNILKQVLDLPWGFEIYSLLTRWNPLSFASPYPKLDTNAKILVVGMGPAGFTLAHYLLNEGHIVVGIDGLKIEALDNALLKQPVKHVASLFESLDTRLIGGFGGVMEYGITNRWNKNFLLIIRLLLQKRANFKLFGGVRFGSNITPAQAFALGFCHVALAVGAGSPKLLELKDTVAKGIRTASDFLMSLQLGAAYRADSLTNLQLRMPIIVIGGGLTALDTATEAMAYYPALVKKLTKPSAALNEEEQEIYTEFSQHAALFNDTSANLEVMKALGGVKILYRNKIQKAPSYRLNHEELSLGLQEGVEFVENITPKEILLDKYGHVKSLKAIQIIDGKEVLVNIEAKTILIAAGTAPNVTLAAEFPEYLNCKTKYFSIKQDRFIAYNDGKNSISFFGDAHPQYAGNVVKAMASAKHGYPIISQLANSDNQDKDAFFSILDQQLNATLIAINRLTSNIIELVIKSPLAAENFQPGQFFRLQNYADKPPLIEGIALTGAKVDRQNGIISTILLEMGASSKLCSQLELNKPVVLMGPTGHPTQINAHEKVMLIGGGLGNAVLFSIGQALRAKNSQVLYFAGYRALGDRYKIEEIEQAADKIIWSSNEGLLTITREQDLSFHGNIVESLLHFAKNNPQELKQVDRIIVIGSDKMMHAVKIARHNALKPYLSSNHTAIASINSPMQCMMKEICGQCLQKHIDPNTGIESYVFSCSNQDQDMDQVDFYHLEARLAQNHLLEKR